MRDATFTALPHISYWGFRAPITPATTAPIFIPVIPTSYAVLLILITIRNIEEPEPFKVILKKMFAFLHSHELPNDSECLTVK
uniref:Uncharacterized protein n=1 Tax=Glossina palpalis gambiensis TaxID=67801 RepID=A0A1B0B6N8_9MUSC